MCVSRPGLWGTADTRLRPSRASSCSLVNVSRIGLCCVSAGGFGRPGAALGSVALITAGLPWMASPSCWRELRVCLAVGCLVGYAWRATVGDQAARLSGSVLRRGSESVQLSKKFVKELTWQGVGVGALGVFGRALGARVHEQQHGTPLGAMCGVCFQYCVYVCFTLLRVASRVPAARSPARPGAAWCDVHVRCPFPTPHYCPCGACGLAGLAAPRGERRIDGDLCHVARSP
jgi:hypothetical protein